MAQSLRQITIIGTGLIGGSLGLALRKNGFRGKIVGCDRGGIPARARRMGAIHTAVADPVAACEGSDLVVLATPVAGIIELIGKLAPRLGPDALVTDVGSTKAEVVLRAHRAFGSRASRQFLPGHPIAGKERSGIAFADPDLFRGAVWFFTPLANQDLHSGRAADFIKLVRRIGARVETLAPAGHDQLCAWLSHVPQMLSTALASALIEEYGENA